MHEILAVGLANAIAASVLAIPALAISRWGRRPAIAHMLWVIVLVKLVTPPLWHVPLGRSAAMDQAIPSTPVSDSATAAVRSEEPLAGMAKPVALAADIPPLFVNAPVAENAQPSGMAIPWKAILLGVWLTGTILVALLTVWRMTCFVRCLRRLQPAAHDMQNLADNLATRLGLKAVPILSVASIRMPPLAWGRGRRARIIVPAELWNELDHDQRSMLLVHELAHLRRGDHWVRLLEIVVRTLYWWHPVVWIAGRELREAEEQCCDAWAVWALPAAAKSYARALVDTVDFLAKRKAPLPAGASGIGQVRDLRRRLIMIMRGTTPRKLSTASLAGLVVLGGLAVALGPGLAQENPQPELLTEAVGVPAASQLAPLDDQSAEIARLRQQEASLRQAMEAVARSLDQTRKQLSTMQGDEPRPVQPPPVALPRRQPNNAIPPAPVPQRPLGMTVHPPQPPAPSVQRPGREQPLEQRLSRLEEQMSQIATEIQALRRDMRPRRQPSRPGMAPPASDGVLNTPPPAAVPPTPSVILPRAARPGSNDALADPIPEAVEVPELPKAPRRPIGPTLVPALPAPSPVAPSLEPAAATAPVGTLSQPVVPSAVPAAPTPPTTVQPPAARPARPRESSAESTDALSASPVATGVPSVQGTPQPATIAPVRP